MAGAQAEIDALLAQAQAPEAEAPAAAPSAAGTSGKPDKSGAASPGPANEQPPIPDRLARILQIEVPLIVVLARRKMPVREILRLSIGSIIEFDQAFDQELELLVSNRSIAFGQAVKVGENFGLRLARIADVKTRIDAMGPDIPPPAP